MDKNRFRISTLLTHTNFRKSLFATKSFNWYCVIREKSHCTFLPLDSRNQESAQIPGFWNPMEGAVGFFSDHCARLMQAQAQVRKRLYSVPFPHDAS
jgi:hypothetical protein